ncbi:MAG: M73 family metallopeptidase [Oscillospiraceae bacterium]|nr:M73 family metallopeptidase [Oscillospiraceae bacterium]
MRRREQNRRIKKIASGAVLAFLGVALVIVIAVGGAMAWFTGGGEVKNTFTMGKIKLQLDEPHWNDADGLDLQPGAVRRKDPTVTALSGRSYMRVRLEIVDGTGALLADEARLALILQTLFYDKTQALSEDKTYALAELEALQAQGKIDSGYNRAAFVYAGHARGTPAVRYYNYIADNGIFDAASNDSATLFSHVVIAQDLSGRAFELLSSAAGYRLRLKAEAMQSDEMTGAAAAFAALNKATGVEVEA